ncbi:MAG: hypothetical protein CUN55_17490 [Phototrophicales bacterium]|nr:MAG: hypothetical protein CUN55_17490 [Phototrophicales bacterium]
MFTTWALTTSPHTRGKHIAITIFSTLIAIAAPIFSGVVEVLLAIGTGAMLLTVFIDVQAPTQKFKSGAGK